MNYRTAQLKHCFLVLGNKLFQSILYPPASKIEEAAGFAIRKFCGIEGEKEKTLYGRVVGWQHLTHPERLQKRVREGLMSVLHHPDREQMSPLGLYLNVYQVNTASQWFVWKGTLHRFRRGEKKKAEERVKAYFNEDEIQNFRQLHEIMRSYMARN